EKTNLAEDGGTHEVAFVVDLRADFEATAATDAGGEFVGLLLRSSRHARAFAEVVGAIDRYPGLDALETVEHELPIDREIADDGKLREWFEANGLFELVDECGASHTRAAVDEHGAGTTDFFETIGVVGDRRGLLAVASDGVLRDIAQADDDVHRWAPFESK